MDDLVIFQSPPSIPSELSGIDRYKFELKEYKTRTKAILYIFLEIIGTLLLLGLIWINVDWVKIAVTIISILFALLLLIALAYIL